METEEFYDFAGQEERTTEGSQDIRKIVTNREEKKNRDSIRKGPTSS